MGCRLFARRRLPGFIYKGFTVGTFHLCGVLLMGAHLDFVQSTVVFILGMVGAVADSAADGFIFVCHDKVLRFSRFIRAFLCYRASVYESKKNIPQKAPGGSDP